MRTDVDDGTATLPILKALAEPLRWRIVQALAREELCVCHLTEELGAPQPLISHHLRVLRKAGLVESEKWRYWTYYRLRADALRELADGVGSLADARASAATVRRPCC